MESPTGTESARLVSPRGGPAGGSLRLDRYSRHRIPAPPASAPPSPAPPAPAPVSSSVCRSPRCPGPAVPSGSSVPLQPPRPQPRPGGAAGPPAAEHRLRRLLHLHGRGGDRRPAPAGGYLAHSLAIMTDAAHLLTDVGSMAVSLFSLRVSTHAPTKTMSFGWHRSETLGALASVLSIWVVTGALVYLAAARIISNDYEIEARAMLATSAGAVGVNLVMAHILHQTPTGCGVGGPRSRDCRLPPAQPGSASVRAAFVHVVGDLLQSLGVLTAAAIIYAKPQYKIADPISTLFFSVFVLGSTITILRDVLRVLMEGGQQGGTKAVGGAPRGLEFDTVKATLLGVSGVQSTHDLHLWALTLGQPALSAHVAIDAGADPELVLRDATAQLRARFGVTCCTLQVERYQEEMGGCPHCRDPCA
ncbi:probable proton-coupled zinc antiporter SLC30A3 isoform X3 [Cuculus canorus]|uniref:probable proton-coupled zinc antiporter SLC30A3 isoform X3 n=1 Tax=Cuculus canorus TaxID=55661 RepID=UPI0023AB3BAA|nr:probable proton-coupled zinc antiporter SLC30A3 isoform X3 [Cuculus canorus]